MKRAAILLPLVLTGCLFGGGDDRARPRPASTRPITLPLPTPGETQACFADLARDRIRYSPLPDRDYGGGCQIVGAVQLIDIGVPVTGITAMRCGLAVAFAGWARNAVAPAAHQILGSNLVRVETYGSYACRNVIGSPANAGKRSGHAAANAVDVSGFLLADGRHVTMEHDWKSGDPQVRDFIATIHRSACKRFGTVLCPDYNAAHHNHLHLEDDHARFCR